VDFLEASVEHPSLEKKHLRAAGRALTERRGRFDAESHPSDARVIIVLTS
jgi:hypothetical protein